ncbi:thiazole synthase [Clostridium algifaecis]|uniref:Thiazole synthase n=1 Tax=Clostridium algifaecis TaxID=1472040 RepID=A0ABS4KUJ4_9CLOT|nr:thiazole synthase [Clostridium algifaecis]MBP2033682.1 thiazole synthase [Clostridium algifaecis]
MDDKLIIGGKEFKSRLFIGTGKYSSDKLLPEVLKKSGTEMVTVALRRVDMHSNTGNIMDFIGNDYTLLPNTSSARTADEVVRLAKLGRAAGCGNWIKIEAIADNKYLLPDNIETIKATEILVNEGFVVLPYINPDLGTAKRLVDAGAAAVMPLGAPIGSNRGLKTKEMLRILIDEIDIPIVVDAGIGKPSDANLAMEMGADAVLVNTAVATAKDPVLMAEAFKYAVEAGRKAYIAGLGAEKDKADASSPLTGFLG